MKNRVIVVILSLSFLILSKNCFSQLFDADGEDSLLYSKTNRLEISEKYQGIQISSPQDSLFLSLYLNTLELYGEQFESTADFYQFKYDLDYAIKNKINLNTCQAFELEKLRVLTPLQIHSILKHRKEYGNYSSLLELQSVEYLEFKDIKRILPFLTVDEYDFNQKKIKSKAEFSYRITSRTGREKGYDPNTPDSQKFLGQPFSHLLRGKVILNKYFEFGFNTLSQFGEPIGLKYNPNTIADYLGGYWQFKYRNTLKIIAGNYIARFGQGLNIWKGFGLNRSSEVMFSSRTSQGFTPNLGSNQYLGLQGVCANYSISNKIEIYLFTSRNIYDARLSNYLGDSNVAQYYSSLLNSGLHRNLQEIGYKNDLTRDLSGLCLEFHNERLNLGIISSYGRNHTPQVLNFYNKNYITDTFFNHSIYHSYSFRNIRLYGEFAIDKRLDIATIQGINISFSKYLDGIFSYRYFSPNYYSPYGSAFSANFTPFNEKGIFAGFTYKPSSKWAYNLSLENTKNINYAFRLADLKPSNQVFFDVIYSKKNILEYNFRARYHSFYNNIPQTDNSTTFRQVGLDERKSFRLQQKYFLGGNYIFTNRIEYVLNNWVQQGTGFLMFFDISTKNIFKKWNGSFRYTYFEVSDGKSRVYAYENDVESAYSIVPYFGIGQRLYATFDYKLSKEFKIQTKFGFTFLNQGKFGSGISELNVPYRGDMSLQLIWKW